jgi:hypothetical protein
METENSMSNGATHVYCDTCGKIQPAEQERLEMIDVTRRFMGGDILCSVCGSIIASVYREITDDEWTQHV